MNMCIVTLLAVVLLTACTTSVAPPEHPPEYTEPPVVTTDNAIRIVVSTDVPMGLTELRAFLVENPFIDYLVTTDSIAAPKDWESLHGTWLTPGASRRLRLEDGHFVIERILENRPELFRYQIWTFTNAAGRGVEQIVGEQRFFELSDRRTRFEWTYNVRPRSALTGWFVNRRKDELREYMQNGTDRMAAAASGSIARAD
ncbi:MAG: hypothetical protein AAFU65_03220 [Pseudomonadota bacterium]